MSYPFTRLGPQVVAYSLCPFLETRDLVRFFNTNKKGAREQLDEIREIVERLLFSRIPVFGKTEYQQYWGVKITDQFEPNKIDIRILRTFLETYYGPNPVDATNPDLPRDQIRGVKNTCLIPTVVPSDVWVEGRYCKFNLNLLGDIAEHPRIGNVARYYEITPALQQRGEDSLQEAHLQIVLSDVIAPNASWERQVQRLKDLDERTGYGCEPEPDALSISTAVFAHQAVTKEGAFLGMYSRTKELGQYEQKTYHVTVGGSSPSCTVDPHKFPMELNPALILGDLLPELIRGDLIPALLYVEFSLPNHNLDFLGVAVQRKFRPLRTQPHP